VYLFAKIKKNYNGGYGENEAIL